MKMSEAQFKAIRERVGLSQKAVAERLGNTVDMVKKWENPKYTYQPPADACDLLAQALDAHVGSVRRQVAEIRDKADGRPIEVELVYFRSQSQHDAYTSDGMDWEVVNARTREVAVLVEQLGIGTVVFRYPENLQ